MRERLWVGQGGKGGGRHRRRPRRGARPGGGSSGSSSRRHGLGAVDVLRRSSSRLGLGALGGRRRGGGCRGQGRRRGPLGRGRRVRRRRQRCGVPDVLSQLAEETHGDGGGRAEEMEDDEDADDEAAAAAGPARAGWPGWSIHSTMGPGSLSLSLSPRPRPALGPRGPACARSTRHHVTRAMCVTCAVRACRLAPAAAAGSSARGRPWRRGAVT